MVSFAFRDFGYFVYEINRTDEIFEFKFFGNFQGVIAKFPARHIRKVFLRLFASKWLHSKPFARNTSFFQQIHFLVSRDVIILLQPIIDYFFKLTQVFQNKKFIMELMRASVYPTHHLGIIWKFL